MDLKQLIKFYPYKNVFLFMLGFLLGIVIFNLDMERLIKIDRAYTTIYSQTKLIVRECKE